MSEPHTEPIDDEQPAPKQPTPGGGRIPLDEV